MQLDSYVVFKMTTDYYIVFKMQINPFSIQDATWFLHIVFNMQLDSCIVAYSRYNLILT